MADDTLHRAMGLRGKGKGFASMKWILAVLSMLQDPITRECKYSFATIQEISGLGEWAVRRALKEAIKLGHLTMISGKVNHEVSRFTLLFTPSETEVVEPNSHGNRGSYPLGNRTSRIPTGVETEDDREVLSTDRKIGRSPAPIQSQISPNGEAKLVPGAYPMDSAEPNLEVRLLVEAFLNYQKNPAFNKPVILSAWYERFKTLLQTYPLLSVYMKYGFEEDPFWSQGKLIRGMDSVSKGGEVRYPDPLDYFEAKLPKLITNYNRKHSTRRAAAACASGDGDAAPNPTNPAESLWDRQEMARQAISNLDSAKAYFNQHQQEYEHHPQWAEWKKDFEFRRIICPIQIQ